MLRLRDANGEGRARLTSGEGLPYDQVICSVVMFS